LSSHVFSRVLQSTFLTWVQTWVQGMSKEQITNKIAAIDVLRKPTGMYLDGAGLYLQVSVNKRRSWIFRFTSPTRDKVRDMGLGPTHTIGLAQARELANQARGLVASGIDPIDERNISRQTEKQKASMTFENAVEGFIAANRHGWTNTKSEGQWRSSLKMYAYPIIGKLPVKTIAEDDVLKILEPIWHDKKETASRVRGRIERILDRETALKHRSGENPARLIWLNTALGKQSHQIHHFKAIPYTSIASFMRELKEAEGLGAMALQFTILTLVRTSEALNARMDELDLEKRLWAIPAERMKSRKEHRVPLSQPAIDIVRSFQQHQISDYLFPSPIGNKPLSNNAMLATIKRMGRKGEFTVHGMRSAFRDWAAEQTDVSREVAEAALAHTIPDAVERAYRRGDLFEKRSSLMDEWASYCMKDEIGPRVILFG
jgi:integrase